MFRFHFEKGKYVINKTKPAIRCSFVRSSGNIKLNLCSPTKEKEGLIVDKQSVESYHLVTWEVCAR